VRKSEAAVAGFIVQEQRCIHPRHRDLLQLLSFPPMRGVVEVKQRYMPDVRCYRYRYLRGAAYASVVLLTESLSQSLTLHGGPLEAPSSRPLLHVTLSAHLTNKWYGALLCTIPTSGWGAWN